MLVSPWCKNGSLDAYLDKHKELTDAEKLKLVRCHVHPRKFGSKHGIYGGCSYVTQLGAWLIFTLATLQLHTETSNLRM